KWASLSRMSLRSDRAATMMKCGVCPDLNDEVTETSLNSARREIMAARGLWVRFENMRGTTDAITDVSFSIAEGSAHGVVGESGSGKTVTFLAALGLLGPQATIGGEFCFQGEDITKFG